MAFNPRDAIPRGSRLITAPVSAAAGVPEAAARAISGRPTRTVLVQAGPAVQLVGPDPRRRSVLIGNTGATAVYWGGPDVTAPPAGSAQNAQPTDGVPLAPDVLVFFGQWDSPDEPIYAATSAAAGVAVVVSVT